MTSSGTTFGRVPPPITPTLSVTPAQRPFSAASAATWCAASTIALRPFSGSTPACAARPTTRARRGTFPSPADTMSPLARGHSRARQGARPGRGGGGGGGGGAGGGGPPPLAGLAQEGEPLEGEPRERLTGSPRAG